MDYLLYKFVASENASCAPPQPGMNGECRVFSPFNAAWFPRLGRTGRSEFGKVLTLLSWAVLTRTMDPRSIKLWAFVSEDGRVLHYSVVMPTSMHLPWLTGPGREIGGCLTVPDARGLRLYPFVLSQIAAQQGEAPIYMIVEEKNSASRSGMERAGFHHVAKLVRKRRIARPALYVYAANESTDLIAGT